MEKSKIILIPGEREHGVEEYLEDVRHCIYAFSGSLYKILDGNEFEGDTELIDQALYVLSHLWDADIEIAED